MCFLTSVTHLYKIRVCMCICIYVYVSFLLHEKAWRGNSAGDVSSSFIFFSPSEVWEELSPPPAFLHSLITCVSEKEAEARATTNTFPDHPQHQEKPGEMTQSGGRRAAYKLPSWPGWLVPRNPWNLGWSDLSIFETSYCVKRGLLGACEHPYPLWPCHSSDAVRGACKL